MSLLFLRFPSRREMTTKSGEKKAASAYNQSLKALRDLLQPPIMHEAATIKIAILVLKDLKGTLTPSLGGGKRRLITCV